MLIPFFSQQLQAFELEGGENRLILTVRMGQGGFQDERAEDNQLGGGQLTFDLRHSAWPLAISYGGEYYKKSPHAIYTYEIETMNVLNLLYVYPFTKNDRGTLFAGGGLGRMEVPLDGTEGKEYEYDLLFDIEAGVNYIVWKGLGLCGVYKYLYANKEEGDVVLIDFSEHIILLGLSYTFNINLPGK